MLFKIKDVKVKVFYLFESLIFLYFLDKRAISVDMEWRFRTDLRYPWHGVCIGFMWLDYPILQRLHIEGWVFLQPISSYLKTVSTAECTVTFIFCYFKPTFCVPFISNFLHRRLGFELLQVNLFCFFWRLITIWFIILRIWVWSILVHIDLFNLEKSLLWVERVNGISNPFCHFYRLLVMS